MDANLHVNQALNHLRRVIDYARFVEEDGEATVWLTFEDWHVLADMLFRMGDPSDLLPENVEGYGLSDDQSAILIQTTDCKIRIEQTG